MVEVARRRESNDRERLLDHGRGERLVRQRLAPAGVWASPRPCLLVGAVDLSHDEINTHCGGIEPCAGDVLPLRLVNLLEHLHAIAINCPPRRLDLWIVEVDIPSHGLAASVDPRREKSRRRELLGWVFSIGIGDA